MNVRHRERRHFGRAQLTERAARLETVRNERPLSAGERNSAPFASRAIPSERAGSSQDWTLSLQNMEDVVNQKAPAF